MLLSNFEEPPRPRPRLSLPSFEEPPRPRLVAGDTHFMGKSNAPAGRGEGGYRPPRTPLDPGPPARGDMGGRAGRGELQLFCSSNPPPRGAAKLGAGGSLNYKIVMVPPPAPSLREVRGPRKSGGPVHFMFPLKWASTAPKGQRSSRRRRRGRGRPTTAPSASSGESAATATRRHSCKRQRASRPWRSSFASWRLRSSLARR